jgi:adenosine deaminase
MKYIKELNIDFDNWDDIPMSINEQQIKELYPVFYQFLIKEKIMDIYLEMFNKCRWKKKGDTFKSFLLYYKEKDIGSNYVKYPIYIFDYTLNFNCVKNYNINYYYIFLSLDTKFKVKKN